MTESDLPPEFLSFLRSIRSKRPRTVIEHILKHGYITTEELRELYGYNHPPRAARDVRESGVPLVTFRVESSDGRRIAAYKFGDPARIRQGKFEGRTAVPKRLKGDLLDESGNRCAICVEPYDAHHLQVDHRVPYEVGGNDAPGKRVAQDYMLLCGSCNRAKSWACEHCENWQQHRLISVCESCYWAYPENYSHIAMKPIRRLDLVWTGEETPEFEELQKRAELADETLQAYIKAVLARHLKRRTANEDSE